MLGDKKEWIELPTVPARQLLAWHDTAQRGDDFCGITIGGAHRHVGVACMEVGDQVRQQVTGGRGTGADAQGAALQPAHGLAQRLGLAEGFAQALGMRQQLLTGRSQPHTAAGALVKGFAKRLLQELELAGHCRLRQVQGLSRMADVAVLGNRGECYQLFRGHDSKISAKRIFAILNYDFL